MSFGRKKLSKQSTYHGLYISNNGDRPYCSVIDIRDTQALTLQLIYYEGKKLGKQVMWSVDGNCLYALSKMEGDRAVMVCFPLPKIVNNQATSQVILNDEHIIEMHQINDVGRISSFSVENGTACLFHEENEAEYISHYDIKHHHILYKIRLLPNMEHQKAITSNNGTIFWLGKGVMSEDICTLYRIGLENLYKKW
ncbi:MAG: hypothetical protein IJ244_01715 [Bacteroidaceae bacterium]|nr:hypothetical protein [Bacteroidaceae bacterium]